MKFDLVDHYKIRKSARSVVFVGRESEGKAKHFFIIKDFYPYMGVPWEEAYKVDNEYGVIRVEESRNIYGKKIAKIIVKRADDVPILRDRFTTTYESNVLFHHRVKIDLNIKSVFEIDDNKIRGSCFGCQRRSRAQYHNISMDDIIGT